MFSVTTIRSCTPPATVEGLGALKLLACRKRQLYLISFKKFSCFKSMSRSSAFKIREDSLSIGFRIETFGFGILYVARKMDTALPVLHAEGGRVGSKI